MMQRYKPSVPILAILLVTLLSACGGGGGGGGTTPPPVNSAPTASSVSITDDNAGTAVAGDGLTGSYSYADAENDAEGTSTFRWLRAGAAISGATAMTYTLVSADTGTAITFEVTPVAATGTTTGSAVTSGGITVANAISASFPNGLQENILVNLTAELEIEGIGTFPLSVDLDGTGDCGSAGVCATVENIPEGNQTFTIRFLIGEIDVATANTTGTVASGASSLVLDFPAVSYPDSDGDGFTNLAEIEIGFDPLLASSRPPADSPRFSSSYILVDRVGLSFITPERIESSSYTIKPSL